MNRANIRIPLRVIPVSAAAVTEFATVQELNAATGLSPGYYSVPNVGVTYWDGVSFFPFLTTSRMGTGMEISDSRSVEAVGQYSFPDAGADLLAIPSGSTLTDMESGLPWSTV